MFSVLGSGHLGRSCTRIRECEVDNCHKSHNRLLHTQPDSSSVHRVSAMPAAAGAPVEDRPIVTDAESNVTMMSSEKCDNCIGLRTVPVVLKNG